MPLNFPTSPAVNQQYTFAGRTWIWNGSAWDSYNPGITAYVSGVNGLTGGITLFGGTGISVDTNAKGITITNTGVFTFNGLTGAVSGVTTSTENIFTALQTFSNGIITTGATLSGTVSITGLPLPSANADAANKAYVDNVASVGVHYHTAVVLASTDAETFASGVTYSNGTLGVGATLTKTTPFARLNIDSTDGVTADRILIRSATTQQWNGIYVVTDQGSASNAWILTRASDANNYHPYFNDGLGANDYFFVTSGTSLKNNAYICSVSGGITFGTTPITFALFSTPPVYTAGTGLALNNLQFSNTGILSFNGLTGAVTGITQINAGSGLSVSGTTNVTITNIGVTGFNGLTGNVSGVTAVNAGTGISITGTTNPTITNTGVQSFNGTTGAVTGVSTFNGLTGAVSGVTTSVANTFTALQTFNVGITAAGATLANIRNVNNLSGRAGITFASSSGALPNTILLKDGSNDININSGSGTVNIGLGGASVFGTSSKIKLQTTDGDITTTYGTIDSGTLTSNRTYTLPDASGTFVLDTNISSSAVTSYNGRVGAVQGVSAAVAGTGISVSGATGSVTITNTGVLSFNGLTGGLTLFGGTGMSVLSGGKGITLVNTGVLSIDGSTGAVTNVARTNVTNTFTADQVISSPFAELRITNTILGTTAEYSADNINYYSGANSQTLTFNATNPSNNVTLPNYTTTLAGLAGTQVFTGVNTFNSITNFNAGISASGATFSGNIIAPNIVTSFNGLTGAVSGVTTSVANTFTALQTFNAGITTSGITLNGRITASGLGIFNAGITTSGITLNGNLVASGSGKFNDRVLTDIIVPTVDAGNAGTLYINSTSGGGGGGAITYIGDTVGDVNNTYIAVDDSTPLIILSVPNNQILVDGGLSLNDNCKMFTGAYTTANNTANQAIFTYDGASYCGGEITITVQQGSIGITSIKTCRLLIANTSATVNHTEYGETVVGTDFVTFNVSISGGLVTISMSPTGNTALINSHARVKATLFPVLI